MNLKQKNVPIFFIGGGSRGYMWVREMLAQKETFVGACIMKEDLHETEKYSQKISKILKSHSIPHLVTKNVKEKKYYDFISGLTPSLIIVMGWRTLIPKETVEIPPLGCVGVHESLLPKYRGFAPVNWAVINGETKTGVSLFFLSDGMDNGDIIGQKSVPILTSDTAADLYKKTALASIELLREFLPLLKIGQASRKKQNEKQATYTCARIPDDGQINWRDSTKAIYNLIRALSYPYPGAFTYLNREKLIVSRASIPVQRKFVGRIPGRVVSIDHDKRVEVLTGNGIILIEEISTKGKERQNPAEIIKSIKATLTSFF